MRFQGVLSPRLVLVFAVVWVVAYLTTQIVANRRGVQNRPGRHLVAAMILSLLVAGFFWRVLFTAGAWMPAGGGDLASFYYPLYSFAAKSLNAGLLPLWNPHLFSGMPFAADVQAGALYPPSMLAYWIFGGLDYGHLELLIIGHYFLAAIGTYALLSAFGIGWPGSIIGSVTYTFSGFMVAHLGHVPMIYVAAWFPFVLLCTLRSSRDRSIRWAVLAGLALAMAWLAGHTQIFLYVLLGTGLLWVVLTYAYQPQPARVMAGLGQFGLSPRWRAGREGHWVLSAARLGITLVVAGGAVAIQALPAIELGSLSIRSGIDYETSTQFAARPIGLLQLVLPQVFGNSPGSYWGSWTSIEVLGYVGVVALLLGVIALIFRRNLAVAFFLSLAALSLFLSLGGSTILHGWFYAFVPGFGKVRAPGRYFILLAMGIGGLAAVGGSAVLSMVEDRAAYLASEIRLKWFLYGLAGTLAALVLVVIPVFYALLFANPDQPKLPMALDGLNFLVILLICFAGILLVVYKRNTGVGSSTVAVLLIGLVVLDLFSAGADRNPTPEDVTSGFQQDQAVQFLKSDTSTFRIDSETGGAIALWQPSESLVAGLDDVSGLYNPMSLADYARYWDYAKAHRGAGIYDFLNTKYLIASDKEAPTGKQYSLVYHDVRGYGIYQNSQALPRALVVSQSIVAGSHDAAWSVVTRPGLKFMETVVVEGGKQLASASSDCQDCSSALVTTQNDGEMAVDLKSGQEAYLVTSEAYYPGWRAWVDGVETPVVRANYAFRAVLVPAGTHHVVMKYQPALFSTGRAISIATWSVVALYFAVLAFLGVKRWRETTAPLPQGAHLE